MAKIDEVKETLNTLRTLFSLGIGVIVALAGAVSTLYDNHDISVKFYIAIVSINVLIVFLFLLLRLLFKKTKELREL
ncbi:MAG: hypothetical protein WCL34_15040 [Methylococcaceae bacterium]